MLEVTLKKFGYPNTLVREYKHWYLLRRFEQVTLGSLILICKEQTNAFSKISQESFEEFPLIIKEIETNLKDLFQYEKINYLMLMMVDPEVHFHIVPRYASDKKFGNTIFKDTEWPLKANIDVTNNVDDDVLDKLTVTLREKFDAYHDDE